VERARAVVEHDRTGSAKHNDVARVGGLDQQALGLAAELGVGRLGQDDAARVRQAREQPGEPRRGRLVVDVSVLDRDVEALGHLHGDRPVDEPAPEPVGHLRPDPAPAGAVGGRDRDDAHTATTG
jgi:hypothetical protein